MKSLMAGSPLQVEGGGDGQRQAARVSLNLLPQEPRLSPLLADAACSSYVGVAAAGQLAVLGSSPHSLESVGADLQCGAGVLDVVLLSLDTTLFTVCYQPCAQQQG